MIPIATTRARSGAAVLTPRTIAVGNKLWLEPHLTGGADNDALASLVDYSGTGTSATAASTEQPLYKIGVINNRAAALFDAANDKMSIGAFTLGTLIIAAKYSTTPFGDYSGLWTNATEIYEIGNSGDVLWYPGWRASLSLRVDGVAYAGATNVVNAWHVFTLTDSSPQSIAWILGSDRGYAGRSWNGHVYGLAAYDTALTGATLSSAERYWGRRIGVTF